jgi:hypothetical protein
LYKFLDTIVDGYFAYVDWLVAHRHVAGLAIVALALLAVL